MSPLLDEVAGLPHTPSALPYAVRHARTMAPTRLTRHARADAAPPASSASPSGGPRNFVEPGRYLFAGLKCYG